jgi:hypothetical protein
MKYIIIDAETSQCRTGFNSKDEAYDFLLEHKKPGDNFVILDEDNYEEEMGINDGSMKLIIAPMEKVDKKEDAELFISDGAWESRLGEVAEFAEGLLTTDILENIDTPVKCYLE